MVNEPVTVEVYSSYTFAVEPRAMTLAGARHTVQRTLRRWKTPEHIHFAVLDERDEYFELDYDEAHDVWLVTLLKGEASP